MPFNREPPPPFLLLHLVHPLFVIRRGRDRVRVSNVGPCRYQLLVLLHVAVRAGPRDLHLAGAERTPPLRLTEVGGGRRPLRRHRLIRAVEKGVEAVGWGVLFVLWLGH